MILCSELALDGRVKPACRMSADLHPGEDMRHGELIARRAYL